MKSLVTLTQERWPSSKQNLNILLGSFQPTGSQRH